MSRISVILPLYNEIRHQYLPQILAQLPKSVEVIAVDCGSQDGTCEFVKSFSQVRLLQIPPTHRAGRIEAGLRQASGDILFLHHPRTLPDPRVFVELERRELTTVGWGALTHSFDEAHPLLRFTSWYSNVVRGDGRGIYYLDHCLFVNRKYWGFAEVFPQVEIFEDTLFCRILRRRVWPERLPFLAVTSAVRFRQNGVWNQALLNQAVKVAHWAGVSPAKINAWYERRLSFNQQKPS